MKNRGDNGKGTFLVKIRDTQNGTYQGSVTWIEEQKVENFRSALELFNLINGVVENSK